MNYLDGNLFEKYFFISLTVSLSSYHFQNILLNICAQIKCILCNISLLRIQDSFSDHFLHNRIYHLRNKIQAVLLPSLSMLCYTLVTSHDLHNLYYRITFMSFFFLFSKKRVSIGFFLVQKARDKAVYGTSFVCARIHAFANHLQK